MQYKYVLSSTPLPIPSQSPTETVVLNDDTVIVSFGMVYPGLDTPDTSWHRPAFNFHRIKHPVQPKHSSTERYAHHSMHESTPAQNKSTKSLGPLKWSDPSIILNSVQRLGSNYPFIFK